MKTGSPLYSFLSLRGVSVLLLAFAIAMPTVFTAGCGSSVSSPRASKARARWARVEVTNGCCRLRASTAQRTRGRRQDCDDLAVVPSFLIRRLPRCTTLPS